MAIDSDTNSLLPDYSQSEAYQNAVNDSYNASLNRDLSIAKKLQEYDTLLSGSSVSSGLGGSLYDSAKPLTQDELIARKQERLSAKVADLTQDDSNFMLKMKGAYNTVNDLWDGSDLKANYLGKQHTMSNKTFEDVNATMEDSIAKKQELIDTYNMAEDDPNSKHKVYQLRLRDGYDSNGNPIYTYKTGIAETSAAERYKNQMIKGGYEILSEKGFAGAEDWENQWHGLKSNLVDRTFDEGYNASGTNIKSISGFGDGYSEIYNTGSFDTGQTQEEIAQNRLKSESLANESAARRAEGYGRGSDSIVDAFQAGAVKLGMDTLDTALDIVTPGDNTLLNEAADQSNIDKFVGYNRKSADKAIGEATGYFNNGQYARALWEVLKEPEIVAESIPMMLGMSTGFGGLTAVGKIASGMNAAKKVGDIAKYRELATELANDVTIAQKGMYEVAKNAGFLTVVAGQTNDQINERVKNKETAGLSGSDAEVGLGETAMIFGSNLALLGMDRFAFNKITGLEGGKAALGNAFGFADAEGKKKILAGVLKTAGSLTSAGATEGAQEYIQTWGEIVNKQLGVDEKTFNDVISDKKNQDEAIGAMLAGTAGGIQLRGTSDNIEKGYDLVTGKEGKDKYNAMMKSDYEELNNIVAGNRTADQFEVVDGVNSKERDLASKKTINAIKRNGADLIFKDAIYGGEKTLQDGSIDNSKDAASNITKLIKALNTEYTDESGYIRDSNNTAKVKFERATTELIYDTMNKINSAHYNKNTAKIMLEKSLGADTVASMSEDEIASSVKEKLDAEKLKIATAIGQLGVNGEIDKRLIGGVIEKYRANFVDKKLEDIIIRTQKESQENPFDNIKTFSATDSGDSFDLSGINTEKNKEKRTEARMDEIDKEREIITASMTEKEFIELTNNVKTLYSLSGGKDAGLAQMLEDFTNATIGSDGIVNLPVDKKQAYNVAGDILSRGFSGSSTRKGLKSLNAHEEDIKSTSNDLLDIVEPEIDSEGNAIKLGSKPKKLDNVVNSLISNVQSFTNFATSRSNGVSDYLVPGSRNEEFFNGEFANLTQSEINKKVEDEGLSDKQAELIKAYSLLDTNASDFDSNVSSLANMIISSKGGTKELRQSELRYLNDKKSRFADKKPLASDKNRKFKAATAGTGMIASFLYESDKVVEKIDNSIDSLNLAIDKLEEFIANGKSGKLDSKKLDTLKESRDYLLSERKSTLVNKALFAEIYKKTRTKDESQEIATDETTIKDLLIKESEKGKKYTKGTTTQTPTQTKPEAKSEIVEAQQKEVKEVKESKSIEKSEDIITSEPQSRIEHSEDDKSMLDNLVSLYKTLISKNKVKELGTTTITDAPSSYTNIKDSTPFVNLKEDDRKNKIVQAHELFHHVSYNVLEKKLVKADREFVSNIKEMFISGSEVVRNITKGKSDRTMLNRDINNLIDVAKNEEGIYDEDIFTRELSAVLYSNSEARKEIVNAYESYNIEKGEKVSILRKAIGDFIVKVFSAYKEVIDLLSNIISTDKGNGVKTDTKEYRQMLSFIGRATKIKAKVIKQNVIQKEYNSLSKLIKKSNTGSIKDLEPIDDFKDSISELENPSQETLKDIQDIIGIFKEINNCEGK